MTPQRPAVILKAAMTADGRIASAFGESQWITGCEARQAGHVLRDQVDAVIVGSGTLLADDPALTTRIPGGRNARPVVLDSQLRCPSTARILTAGLRPLIFCAASTPMRDLPAEIVPVPTTDRGLCLHSVFKAMLQRGLHSALVEGGGAVHRSMLDGGHVDRIELFMAPLLLTGGPGWVGGAPLHLSDALRMTVVDCRLVGGDVQISMTVEPRP